MQLSALLHNHLESYDLHGLPYNLGDNYLCEKNKIYRNVRHETVKLGFTFSNKPDVNYLAFPMAQLENILTQKVIPFTDNVSALKLFSEQTGSLDWDHVVDNLKPNYVFHESCHAIARAKSQNVPRTSLELKLTTLLLEESFANTCEFFAIADANDQTHRNFLEINSYFTLFDDRTHLKRAIEAVGAADVFKFMLLSYLHSNFLNEKLNDGDFRKVLNLCGLQAPESERALKSLAQNCFALNPRFRYTTTEMYLRSQKINTPVELALNFDYIQIIENNEALMDFINSLSQITGANNGK